MEAVMKDGEKKDTIFVGVRLIPEARDLLFELAKQERRSVSNQIEHMVMQQSLKQYRS